MTERIRYENRNAWLQGRRERNGIGASEAGAILGDNPSLSRMDLWKIKTGAMPEQDLSDNELVQRGIRMEKAVRYWFKCSHPELRVVHHPYDILFQTERPWLFATLDGEFTHRDSGEAGILEIKTAEPRGRSGWEEWDGRIPQKYYDQLLHQHLATGRRWFFLAAALWSSNGDVVFREFEFLVDDGIAMDAQIVLQSEELFMRYVRTRQMPPTPIKL